MGKKFYPKVIHYLVTSTEFAYGNRLHICIYSTGDELFLESLFSDGSYRGTKLKFKNKIKSIESGLILSGKIFKNPIENLPFKKSENDLHVLSKNCRRHKFNKIR